MNRFVSTTLVAIFLSSVAACSGVASNTTPVSQQESGSGSYCHKKLQPVGPSDLARPNQSGSGDFIDYYGPCDGPTLSDQIQQQKRFESFRFGREYMDEG
jgi:hypothetical protein